MHTKKYLTIVRCFFQCLLWVAFRYHCTLTFWNQQKNLLYWYHSRPNSTIFSGRHCAMVTSEWKKVPVLPESMLWTYSLQDQRITVHIHICTPCKYCKAHPCRFWLGFLFSMISDSILIFLGTMWIRTDSQDILRFQYTEFCLRLVSENL